MPVVFDDGGEFAVDEEAEDGIFGFREEYGDDSHNTEEIQGEFQPHIVLLDDLPALHIRPQHIRPSMQLHKYLHDCHSEYEAGDDDF